jgi:hypothetical protein
LVSQNQVETIKNFRDGQVGLAALTHELNQLQMWFCSLSIQNSCIFLMHFGKSVISAAFWSTLIRNWQRRPSKRQTATRALLSHQCRMAHAANGGAVAQACSSMAELELPPSQRSDHGGKIPLPQAA